MPSSLAKAVSTVFQLIAAAIMGQTLFYKFSADPMSVQLFTELGMEPQGRLIIGTLELIACILLLIPSSVVYGATLAIGLMGGAIIGHVTKLGWEGERLSLGLLAVAVFVACLIILWLRKKELPLLNAVLKEQVRKN